MGKSGFHRVWLPFACLSHRGGDEMRPSILREVLCTSLCITENALVRSDMFC